MCKLDVARYPRVWGLCMLRRGIFGCMIQAVLWKDYRNSFFLLPSFFFFFSFVEADKAAVDRRMINYSNALRLPTVITLHIALFLAYGLSTIQLFVLLHAQPIFCFFNTSPCFCILLKWQKFCHRSAHCHHSFIIQMT